jgi:transcriptional regulator with XRE-family HTH domain
LLSAHCVARFPQRRAPCQYSPQNIDATTSEVVVKSAGDFAAILRAWRRRRGWSQLELAGRADISQRHLSFLEIGRVSPSRDMVARLAAALDLPLRQHTVLLVAAGFAPVWRETAFAAPELARVGAALTFTPAQQEPFPAVVVDRPNKRQSQSCW